MALYPALEGASGELWEKWSELDDDSLELTVRACSAVWIFSLLFLMRNLQCPSSKIQQGATVITIAGGRCARNFALPRPDGAPLQLGATSM